MTGRRARESSAPAITRAAAVLDELATEGSPLGISELARRLSLAKSSVANICRALEDVGLARRVGTSYGLGRRLVELGRAYLATEDIVQDFHRACAMAAGQLEETVQLATLDRGLEVVYLARRDGTAPVVLASDVGRRLPANCTALGKVMLASLPPDELERRLAECGQLPALTPQSITSKRALRLEFAAVRARQYALDDEETAEGIMCVAVALTPEIQAGNLWAISATLLKARADSSYVDQVVGALQALALEIVSPGSLRQRASSTVDSRHISESRSLYP